MAIKKETTSNEKKKIIEIKDVYKTYNMGDISFDALRKVNIDINAGEFVIILGPSGSGKSTLLNIVGCLDIPSKGQVLLNGIDVSTLSESHLAKIRGKTIGFIFQQFNLIPTFNALQNVMLPIEFQNVSANEAEKEAHRLLDFIDLKDRKYHLPNEMSGGQQQRVAIARALAGNPEIILADEPTGNLDTKTGDSIIDFLQELNKKGKTIIMVTHDLNKTKYGTKIIHIIDGKINKIENKQSKEI